MQSKVKWMMPTFLKYFLSYLIILCVVMLGSWFIVRTQITNSFLEQRVDSTKMQVDYASEEIRESLMFLMQIDNSLSDNDTLLKYSYQIDAVSTDDVIKELRLYDTSAMIISNIVYMSKETQTPLSTSDAVSWKNGCFEIAYPDAANKVILDPASYVDSNEPQLVSSSANSQRYLFYFPATSSKKNSFLFYTLNMTEIQSKMKAVLSEEVKSVALVDRNGNIIKGENASLIQPYLNVNVLESGKYEQKDNNYLCVSDEILNGYRLVTVVDGSFLMKQVSNAFAVYYLQFFWLSVGGCILILLGMKMTYYPLRQLIHKVDMTGIQGKYHLKQLEDVFDRISNQNQEMRSKLDNYRASIQRSLLDSLISLETNVQIDDAYMDQVFDETIYKEFFIIRLCSSTGIVEDETFRECIRSMLGEDVNCILLEVRNEWTVYLINYIGDEGDKAERMKQCLEQYHQSSGCLAAMSKGSEVPTDIPELYENARLASGSWPGVPVADGASLSEITSAYSYPYERLNSLAECLAEHQYDRTKQLMGELFVLLDDVVLRKEKFQDYYIQNVILNILINIANAMGQSGIQFERYSNEYYETLYFCRSYSYNEKSEAIKNNIGWMLDFYEETNKQKMIDSLPFKKAMEEWYCEPDFSIAMLAEQFGVSTSYMSYQFKNELNVTFSEYLWMLRLRKAKELLTMTDMSVDEIAIAVGYYSRTSFIRKFKQETGLTPSQYRMEN